MRKSKLTYFLSFCLFLILISCKQTRLVPDGSYLVSKNILVFEEDKLNADEVNLIIRQQPNNKLKLYTFNTIDTNKVKQDRIDRLQKAKSKHARKTAHQKKVNNRRIKRAQDNGDSLYTQLLIPPIDTINVKLSLRAWIQTKLGEKPVIFDSTAYNKSVEQLQKYMQNKGYFYGNVSASYSDSRKNPKKRTITYTIRSGKAYYIDSIKVSGPNAEIISEYYKYLKKQIYAPIINERYDRDKLEQHRYDVAKFMRDESYYGFSPTNIRIEVDSSSTNHDMKATMEVIFSDRVIVSDDKTVRVQPHQSSRVNNVYFHLIDTSYYKGNFALEIDHLNKKYEKGFAPTLDTFFYHEIYMTKSEKRKRHVPQEPDSLNPFRFAYFYYNGTPFIRPGILELQNYLEYTNTYKDYYLDRSYSRLLQMDVFQTIKPEIIEIKNTNKIDVHYYLVPSKKQIFNIEPRFTNSNGFLGLATTVNYNNKNLFRGGEKLTLSFSGGFESQPPIFDESLDGTQIKKAGRSFNTFEIGPSVKLDLPGLFPVSAIKLSKRHRPRTVISTAYNFQKRTDFTRSIFQLNYLWKFYIEKTQIVQFGIPAAAIKFVYIVKSEAFADKLNSSNDLFLKNAYSDQFIWEDLKFLYEYNNKNKDNKKGKINVVYNASLTNAGFLLSLLKHDEVTATGQYMAFGVGYSRFLRVDNDVILGYPINKKTSFHARTAIGLGVPTGNKTTSLPYDYSFFAGGSNDNRGWRARSLGPGSYQYYLDSTNRTATQIGDIRLGGFAELRYSLSPTFKTAIFLDAGNIWTYKKDINRIGAQFSSNFYREIALSIGTGIRVDLSFFIIRLDLGIPLTNPALPNGAKWIFQSRQPYYDEGIKFYGIDQYKSKMPKPFTPILNFGIGYPF